MGLQGGGRGGWLAGTRRAGVQLHSQSFAQQERFLFGISPEELLQHLRGILGAARTQDELPVVLTHLHSQPVDVESLRVSRFFKKRKEAGLQWICSPSGSWCPPVWSERRTCPWRTPHSTGNRSTVRRSRRPGDQRWPACRYLQRRERGCSFEADLGIWSVGQNSAFDKNRLTFSSDNHNKHLWAKQGID